MVSGCSGVPNIDKTLSEDYYSSLKEDELHISPSKVRKWINHYAAMDNGQMESDRFLKRYYKHGGKMVWVSYGGVIPSADSLLTSLDSVSEYGLNTRCFYARMLRKEISRYRNLDYKEHDDINKSIAKIEFYLSKSYLRYVCGQRFGFINPNSILNDSVACAALPVVRPDSTFFKQLMQMATEQAIMDTVYNSKPQNPEFYELMNSLKKMPRKDSTLRRKYLIAIERRRWKWKMTPEREEKYVIVNIPACRLWAVTPDSIINMKVVCGSEKTPSPLLSSRIYRIDLNPEWIIPHSIVKKSLLHVGRGYLASRHMFFVDKASGQKLDYASPQQRLDGSVRMVQEGGEGNSLGRIIFRFKNDFSVYLHSTNAPWAFESDTRTESHGCIRVENPYRLACTILGDKGVDLREKLLYSISYNDDEPDKSMLLHNIKVDDNIPVFLDYMTVFRSPQSHKWINYKDIYGYDAKLYSSLKYWVQ